VLHALLLICLESSFKRDLHGSPVTAYIEALLRRHSYELSIKPRSKGDEEKLIQWIKYSSLVFRILLSDYFILFYFLRVLFMFSWWTPLQI